MDIEPQRRKHPAHGVLFIDNQPTIIFDTVCTKNREPWLATDEIHKLLCEVWRNADLWLMGRYIIMPDHIHFFAAATENSIEYDNWVTYWKSQFTKRHKNKTHRWQSDHWDTRMRTAKQYEEKWDYVRRNAERHGLVSDADDWMYQGDIYDWRWE